MGKNLNPADAYRKSLRKKELKKNKAERSKARDFALVKKDTRDLEEEIEKLEGLPQPSAADKSRLSTIKAELEKINAKKEDYVKEHPEQRRLVYRPRRDRDDGKPDEELILPKKRNYFDKNGLPRHPERSIYYDKIMNPYGVAPPGMPYMERPLLPGEVDSEAEDDEDPDDDIIMPVGPPPGIDEPVDSDDDISMPEDPSGAEGEGDADIPSASTSQHPLLPGPPPSTSNTGVNPPLPPGLPPLPAGMPFPPPPPLFHTGGLPPLPPAGFSLGIVSPPPHAGFPAGNLPPPPPMGFPNFPSFPPNLPPPPPHPMSQPPPGFFPRREKSTSAMQDPLSSIPHQTYQAHRANHLAGHPSLPAKPGSVVPPRASTQISSTALTAAATISAEPQLRDLKKEATAFVPSALKRKRGGASSASTSRVNAAPGVGNDDDNTDSSNALAPARPDLLSTLRNQFGSALPAANSEEPRKKLKVEPVKKNDDYERFVEEIGDILNPS
ncbi:WW domain binding protein 11-domain-containing protein [Lentinula lateritia]|uniref:WW domain binding protein 11-domain-containing protein n=1 Tax=Lentinula lateritia TaxID=40482 RepID=A0ABQ8VAK3_9AGAR|nr:WW domain binding protein 11-domain-containing protein [Lentinula lateritia]